MSKRLGDDDAFAVDLLMDRTPMLNNGNSGSGIYLAPVGDGVAKRIGAVETVFRLIGQMPAADPPAGLVNRTLQRVLQHSAPAHEAHQPAPNLGQGNASA